MADQSGNSRLNQWAEQAQNPAAPAGQQQVSRAGQGVAAGNPDYANSRLGAWANDPEKNAYVDQARSWFTGANNEGTQNGWDSGFVDEFNSGWSKALETGQAANYFELPTATGIVFRDHESSDGTRKFEFGDIYENGKKVANLYDQNNGGFDRDTANLMLAPWLLDRNVQERTFSSSDRMERLEREIQGARTDRNENFEKMLSSTEFQGKVDKTQESIQEGIGDEALAAGSGVLTAALAAGGTAAVAGSAVGPVGTAVAGLVGFLGGAGAAYLNRDQISEQAARAHEVTKLSFDDNGRYAGSATFISQWAGVGSKLISPMSNMVQGSYDATKGRGGDGQSEFYRVDEEGKTSTPKWVKTLDIGASVGDALLQFASPVGLSIYTTQMSGVIGGEVGELALSGGKTFDYRTGKFDNIFTDEQGGLDLGSAAAGIGKIGIDAVQLGMARGLAGSTNAALADVGEQAAYRSLVARAGEKLPLWMGGTKGLADDAARVRAGGFTFTRGADGAIVAGSGRASLSLLAPSEALQSLSARVLGMREAARRGGAYAADDFYRAAQAMSVGERKMTSALVNGMGEGTEEAVQAVLEPWSHNAAMDVDEVLNSALYGTAAGVGMSMGTALRAPSADQKMFAQAQLTQLAMTGGVELTEAQWRSFTEVEKRQRASLSGMNKETAKAAFLKIAEDQAIEMNAGVSGAAKLADAVQSALTQALAKATDRTDGAFVVTQLEEVTRTDPDGNLIAGTFPAHAVAASALQTAANLTNHLRGAQIQATQLATDVAELEAAVAADPADPELAEQLAAKMRQQGLAQLTVEWGVRFDQVLDGYLERMLADTATFATLTADTEELNDVLRRAFDMQLTDWQGTELTDDDKLALARAVSMVFARDPHDSAGSFQMLVPQVSARLTAENADNMLEISHAILPAISGDYDGDKVRPLNQLILDETEFVSARSGAHFLGAGSAVNVGAPKYEKYIVDQLAESLASNNTTLAMFAGQTLQTIADAIRTRYSGVIDQVTLDEVFQSFFTAVRANDKDARAALLDGLAAKAGGAITDFARTNLSNEWLWIDQLVVSTFQEFQESYAAHRPDLDVQPSTRVSATALPRESEVRTRRAEEAATLGQTLGLWSAGDSMFRKFQKLHYSVIKSPVLSAENLEPSSLTEMAQLYQEIGQMVSRTQLEEIRGKDDITTWVYAQLQILAADAKRLNPALNAAQAMAVVANLRVLDIEETVDGVTSNGMEISLAQMLLKRGLARDRRAKDQIFDASPELQAKHRRLERMTRPNSSRNGNGAEQAFVEIVSSQQLFTLLGDAAYVFGPHLTVEQWIRQYAAQDEIGRRETTRALQSEPEYLGDRQKRVSTKDMPYNLDEVANGEISAYRALVDSMIAVGNERHKEQASRSDFVSQDFQTAHGLIRTALTEFAGLSGRKDGELTLELVQRMLEGNPDVARQVMNLIPNVSANAVLELRGDEVFVSNWLFETFVLQDAAEAEMHYWRNLLLAEYNALGARARNNEEEDGERQSARQYGRLPRRMHRILYKLDAIGDGGVLLKKFIDTMESATSVSQFMEWVNTTPGIRGEQAPLTAWVDDAAEFDVDKAAGGWTTALQGAELREAITTLRTGSERLVESLAAERTALAADTRTRAAIRRVLKKNAGARVTLDPGDQALHDAFVKTLELAADRYVGLGPQAMIYQTTFAALGFYDAAHTKGKNPGYVAPLGAFDAQRDAFDYVTNYERLMGSLTSVNLDAVSGSLTQVAKDAGRAMDDYGREVSWAQPTPEQMLDWLVDPDTRPFARAILYPQVMERNPTGQLSTQLLVGKSLDELLTGATHKELFPVNERLSQDSALRYVSMVEGLARKHGGHFSVQRVVNDLVIARTSAVDHVLSVDEIERMAVMAYYEVAQVLQAAGSVASTPASPGVDPLAEILAEIRSAQRRVRTFRALGFTSAESKDLVDASIEGFVNERKLEAQEDAARLREQLKTPAGQADQANLLAQLAAIDEDVERFEKRIELLSTDDIAGQVVDMFTIPDGDTSESAAAKSAIVDYIKDHMSMLEQVSSVKLTLNKLTQQLLDSGRAGQVRLSDKEWGELSRAAIGVYLEDVSSTTAASVSVSPWPDEDHAKDYRYFDTSFSYLVEDLLRSDGPLVQAAKEIHRLAGRHNSLPTPKAEFIDIIGRTVLDEKRLGPWTGDIPRASIEANQRIDSAAAEAAIAIVGNSPKRQAAIIGATRRTFRKPPEELLSTTTLNFFDLKRDLFDDVKVQLPGAVDTTMPLAQLNNRFARSVTLRSVDGQGQPVELDLMAEFRDLGRAWHGNETVASSEYREIHLGRMLRAVERVAEVHGLEPTGVQLTVEFFHPDSQPAEPGWYNNVYFEGTSFNLDADRHESLIASLWFAFESLSPAGQRSALDASKLGLPALQVIETIPSVDRVGLEAMWQSDLAAMLRDKTHLLLDTDLGFGNLDVEFYNAVYKDMKLRHFVRGTDPESGVPALWSAEQVIAHQLANPGVPLPLDGAALWIPSDAVLRSLLGEKGTQGVARVFPDQLAEDLTKVPSYQGVTETMMSRFEAGVQGATVELAETRVVNRARQSQLVVRPMLDDKVKSAYDARIAYFAERKQEIHNDRGPAQRSDGIGFNANLNLARAVKHSAKMLSSENIAMDWASGGISFIGPRKPSNTALSQMALRDLAAVTAENGFRTGFIYAEGSDAQPQAGTMSEVSLGASGRAAFRLAPGDLVSVELDSFNGNLELAKKRLDYMAKNGVTLVLGSTDGQGDMRAELAEYIASDLGYEKIQGSGHAYKPAEYGSRFQNLKARASTLTATEGVAPKSRVAIFNTTGLGIQEGAAWVRGDNDRLGAIAVVGNLVPTDFLAGFNVPVEQFSNESQIATVRAQLFGLNNPADRDYLKQMANGHLQDKAREKADADFDTDFDALIRRLEENPGTILPPVGSQFGKGSFLPLVDSVGRVLLYRHGYKAPRRDQVDEMAARVRPGSVAAGNMAVFPTKLEPAATTHTGEVVEFKPRAGYGLSVELLVPLSVFGDKKQLEWNGMKYVLVPQPASVVLPEQGFFDNWGIDMISDADTLFSKEAFDGLVDNHQAAFAFLGMDFLPDVTEFFNPGQRDDLEAQERTREMLHAIAKWAPRISVMQADELITTDRLGVAFRDMLPEFALSNEALAASTWLDKLADLKPTENKIAAAMLIYLMTPGARVEDVLRSGGFNDTSTDANAQSRMMPRLFTQIFDDARLGSPLRTEINRRLNDQLNDGYRLHQDWTFEIRSGDPAKNMRGFLQFAQAHSAGDNPVKNGMSFDEAERQQVSLHSGAIAFGAIGAEQAFAHDIAAARTFATGEGVERFTRDVVDGGVWRMLTGNDPKKDPTFRSWNASTPAEQARRDLAREAKVQFRQPINQIEEAGWSTDGKDAKAYADKAVEIVHALNLKDTQTGLVDFWVRQVLGMPHGIDHEGKELGKVSGRQALAAAQDILWNVQNGYMPTINAEQPQLHLHDLQAIYRANKERSQKWQPRLSMDPNSKPASTWDDWVMVSLGSALTSESLFDPLYLLALDGFVHDYQNATASLGDLPVSVDALVAMKLMDPEVQQMLVSTSPDVNQLTLEPAMFDVARADLNDLLGGQRVDGKFRGKAAPASEVAKRLEIKRQWRKENGVPVPVDVTMKNFRKNGSDMVDYGTTTNALARGLINLRVGTALINPALYMSMGPEQWIRGTLDRAANLLTGQGTTGMAATGSARLSDMVDGTRLGEVLDSVGLKTRYTNEQLTKLNSLYLVMGQRTDFKRMIYRDLNFKRPHEDGLSRIGRALEGYAKFGSRMQDPTHGMKATTLARRYLEGALQHIEATPTLNVISVDTLISELRTNPAFLETHLPSAHAAGTNAVAQLRSLKDTPLSLALKGIYEPLSQNGHGGINLMGNVLLKLPLLFSGYAMNVLVTITGMQGYSDMLAMALDGRKKGPNSILGRMQAKMRGEEFNPEKDEFIDMSSVLEGIDLSRSFIRGGLTHAGLFSLGLMAGGLGLSGEDDETKRLRRMAEHQGVGHMYDPRRIENDFRNSDALFLDWLPFGRNYFQATTEDAVGGARAMGELHWMFKQFLSPIVGMEKFFETGDFRQVTWGFQDALGSFPLINTMMWKDAVETANELATMADGQAQLGGPSNLVQAGNLLTTGVGLYERMLFENSFVNQLYIGMDEWDRDQYVLPLTDSDGVIQRDIAGNARPNDLALQSFVDPDTGKVVQGYAGRSDTSARLHTLTENRGTMAIVTSLFTGGIGDSDFWRYNMPIKTRDIEKAPTSSEQRSHEILGAFLQGSQLPTLSETEAAGIIKQAYINNGDWSVVNDPDLLNVLAKRMSAQSGMAGLTLIDEAGREHLTGEGAKAIFRGLYKNSVKLGDKSLEGIYITPDMRTQILNDWTKELTQEGIDLGLDVTKATARMKRVLYGDYGTDQVGLAELLWSKEISFKDTATYKQLNTTYVIGPDGMPWATGYTRDGVMGALGLKPVKRMLTPEHGGVGSDGRLNTVDLVNGMNTGLRALVPLDETEYVPTDVEIGKAIEKAIEEAAAGDYTAGTPYAKSSGGGGSGWVNYGRGGSGYKRYGKSGYSGYSSGGSSYFTRMNPLPDNVSPYSNNMSNINTSNPILRRANIRRERVWSERGRLKQWQ